MQIFYIILGIIGGVAIAYFILNRKKEEKNTDLGLNLILTQINELSRTVDSKIGESHKQVNESLKDNPDTINKDPYGEGWIVKIKLANKVELDSLISVEEYEKITEEEKH